jgi:hypothetical protein
MRIDFQFVSDMARVRGSGRNQQQGNARVAAEAPTPSDQQQSSTTQDDIDASRAAPVQNESVMPAPTPSESSLGPFDDSGSDVDGSGADELNDYWADSDHLTTDEDTDAERARRLKYGRPKLPEYRPFIPMPGLHATLKKGHVQELYVQRRLCKVWDDLTPVQRS